MKFKSVSPGITRFDIKDQKVHGYLARIMRHGERHQKFFSDKSHGGKKKALDAAKKIYEEWKGKLPPKKTTRDQLTPRNASGVVGVHFSHDQHRDWDLHYFSYTASWLDEDGKRRNIRFSWNQHGESKAWALAVLARHFEETDRAAVEKLYEKAKKSGKPAIPKKPPTPKIAKELAKKPQKAKKAAPKKVTKKASAKKSTAKKAATAKKTVAKKSVTKKSAAKKSTSKKVAKKKTAKKTSKRR